MHSSARGHYVLTALLLQALFQLSVAPVIQFGKTTGVTDQWTTQNFDASIPNPLVFAFPATNNEADAAVPQVKDVSGGTFSIRVKETSDLGGAHAAEEVGWMVVAQGDFTTLGIRHLTGNFTGSIALPAFSPQFQDIPTCFAQLQTLDGPDEFIHLLPRLITESSMFVSHWREGGATGSHGSPELAGWVCLSPATVSATLFEGLPITWSTFTTGDVYFDQPTALTINAIDNDVGLSTIVVQANSNGESERAMTRRTNINGNSVDVYLQEDFTSDPDLTHTSEFLGVTAMTCTPITMNIDGSLNGPYDNSAFRWACDYLYYFVSPGELPWIEARVTTTSGDGTVPTVYMRNGQPPKASSFDATLPSSEGPNFDLAVVNPAETGVYIGLYNPVVPSSGNSYAATLSFTKPEATPINVSTTYIQPMKNNWYLTKFKVSTSFSTLSIKAKPVRAGAVVSLYLREGSLPTTAKFNFLQTVANGNGEYVINLPNPTQNTDIFIGVTSASNATEVVELLIDTPPPFIDFIKPTTANTDTTERLTINGADFDTSGSAVVYFGDAICQNTDVVSSSLAFCDIPEGQGTAIPINVTSFGKTSNVEEFSYIKPQIDLIQMDTLDGRVPTVGGTVLTLSGLNFGLVGNVTLGGVTCEIVPSTYSHRQIQCKSNPGQGLSIPVVVTTGGQSSTQYLVSYQGPVVQSVSPATSPTNGSTELVLHGYNFGTSQPSVLLGAKTCHVTFANQSAITCTTPSGQGKGIAIVVGVGGQNSNNPGITFAYTPPQITSLSPANVSTAGGTTSIIGTNFGQSGSITLGGGSCEPVLWGDSLVVCNAPAGVGANINLFVTVGTQQSNTVTFSYKAPVLTSLSPPVLPTRGGVNITIVGENLGVTDATVLAGGSVCIIQTQNHTSIVCLAPSGQGLSVAVSVTVGGLVGAPALSYDYAAPILSSIFPANSSTAGGQVVTIRGEHFGSSGVAYVDGNICSLTSAWTDSTIECSTPEGQGTNNTVTIVVATQISNVLSLDYFPPRIFSVTPSEGATEGQTPISVNGAEFGSSGTVFIDGKPCDITFYSRQQIQCDTPPGRGSRLEVRVVVADQSNSTLSWTYSNPFIQSVSPPNGAVSTGSTDTLLILTGTSFDTSGNVTVGGKNCSTAVFGGLYTNKEIRCLLPPGQGLDNEIVVTSADHKRSNTPLFAYKPPIIVNPAAVSAPTYGRSTLSIDGESMGTSGSVTVGGRPCDILTHTDTFISCVLPIGQGTQSVVVTASQQSSPGTDSITYDPPTITNILPPNSPTVGGTNITLFGENFGVLGSVSVDVSGDSCAVSYQNHSQVVCLLGPGQGAVNIRITVSGQTSAAFGYAYGGPSIDSIDPTAGPTKGLFNMVIRGESFGTSGSVSISGAPCDVVSYNDTTVVCQVREGQGKNKQVTVTSATKTSNPIGFSYDSPHIDYVSPTSLNTTGNDRLTIVGENFGLSGVVTIEQQNCVPVTYAHELITCTTVAGQGRNQSVSVTVESVTSNEVSVDFNGPFITSVFPQGGPTSGKSLGIDVQITISGRDFGSGNNVTFGGVPCSIQSYSQSQIVCLLPVGQGNVQVLVTVASQASNPVAYTYAPPSINSANDLTAGTGGGDIITILGQNFGTHGTVTIGPHACDQTAAGSIYTQSRIECAVPPGSGTDLMITVSVSGQNVTSTAPTLFTYDAPVILALSPPQLPTNGSTLLTLTGSNFAIPSVGFATVFVGGHPCPIVSQAHGRIECDTPEGVGKDIDVVAVVQGQNSSIVSTFAYMAPLIDSIVSPQCVPQGNSVTDCPIAAPFALLTIRGENFGRPNSTVLVGTEPCVNVVHDSLDPHRTIYCTMPFNLGFAVPLSVIVGSQPSNSVNVGYAGPRITPGTIRLATETSGQSSLTVSSVLGGQQIAFDGIFLTLPGQTSVVKLGLPGTTFNNMPYTCAVNDTASNATHIECVLPPGVGKDLVFVLSDTQQLSPESVDTVSYPQPVILPNTIRDTATGAGSNIVTGARSEGDVIYFDVLHIGTDASSLSVHYGQPGGPYTFECTQVTILNNGNDSISCKTSPGDGSGFVFVVTALNQASQEGTDIYKYPSSPIVYSVSGCTDQGNTTTLCPTRGGNALVIRGQSFSKEVSVKIGSKDCLEVKKVDDSTINCVLPPGTGKSSLLVLSGSLFSRGAQLLFYAPPTLSSVSGCPVNQNNLTANCERAGGTNVTLTGANFGVSNALVLVGGDLCTSVVHVPGSEHEQLKCLTPPGTRTNVAVFLVQEQGEVSSNRVALSYQPCPSGTFDATTDTFQDIACTNCSAGSISSTQGQVSCTACPDGFFAPVEGLTRCSKCVKGSFSSQVDATTGATNCTLCERGTFSSSDGAGLCESCESGKFSSTLGATTCELCSLGSENPGVGKSTCTNCTRGKFSSGSGNLKCSDCPAGKFSNETGVSICQDCEVGYSQRETGQVQCERCLTGRFQSARGQPLCLRCNDGSFSNTSGLTTCLLCEPGRAVKQGVTGASSCKLCDEGTYMNARGQAVCLNCPKGEYHAGLGATACLKCPLGTSTRDLDGQSVCLNCTVGEFARSLGTVVCDACEKGTFADETGLSSCKLCPAGKRQQDTGQSLCTPCLEGTAVAALGQADCINCDVGSFTNITGEKQCSKCPQGRITRTSGLSVCELCDKGTFASSQGQGVCFDCPEGSYGPSKGLTECLSCEVGRITNKSAQSNCTLCEPGTFSSSVRGKVCFPCPTGTFTDGYGHSTCKQCPAGKAQDENGKSFCDKCSKGLFQSSTGEPSCQGCPAGSFTNATGLTACLACSRGYEQPATGRSECVQCKAGLFAATEGQASCKECPVGTASALDGASSCRPCSRGRFNSLSGQSECKNCSAGFITSSVGQFICGGCPLGQFNTEPGLSECQLCARGYFQDATGRTVCKPCDTGERQSAQGQSTCESCDVGTYNPSQAQSVCKECPSGSVTTTTGLSVCANCSAGEYSASSSKCDPCHPGTYTPIEGLGECLLCPEGTSQDESGKSKCDLCDVGTANEAVGQKICGSCTSGRFANVTGLLKCFLCEAGTSSQSGAENCADCIEGRFSPTAGSSECTLCPVGKANALKRQSRCENCEAGKFADAAQSHTCKNCSTGFAIGSIGAQLCEICGRGSFASATGENQCTACPRGYFQQFDGKSSCSPCDPGFFAASTGQTLCNKCGVGRFSNSTGATDCTLCDVGRVQPIQGQQSCDECLEGSAMGARGQAVCVQCDSGTFANDTGLSACLRCARGRFSTKNTVLDKGATVCENCQKGSFQGAEGQPLCLDCTFGRFSNVTGLSICATCDPGRSADFAGAQKCVACGEGRFSVLGGPACTECEPGTFTSATGSTSCQSCPSGRFENRTGSTLCFPCQPGSFVGGGAAVVCDLCPPGSFQNKSAAGFCYDCPAGRFQSGSGATGCSACPLGRFQSSTGQSFCVECAAGSFGNDSAATQCFDCAPGSFQPQPARNSCLPCTEGRATINTGSSACEACVAGRFSDVLGLSECFDCVAGKAQGSSGQSLCVNCTAGFFQSISRQTSCEPCDPGSFTAVSGLSTCQDCGEGTFQKVAGRSVCEACLAGTAQALPGQDQCDDCTPGTFANGTGFTVCAACGPGERSEIEVGSRACVPCPAGSRGRVVNRDTLGHTCVECEQGKFSATSGSLTCRECPAGTIQANPGRSTCDNCTAGFFQDKTKQTICKDCPSGTFSSAPGTSACRNCPPGSFNELTGRSLCANCPVGRGDNREKRTQCQACIPGKFSNQTGLTQCKDCQTGFRSAVEFQSTSCVACVPGTRARAVNRDVLGHLCVDCDPGEFTDLSAQTSCQSCPGGKFQGVSGQSKCFNCSAGSITEFAKQTICTDCKAGSIAPLPGLSSCEQCKKGRFQPVDGQDTCLPCAAGTSQITPGSSVCEDCTAGRFSSAPGAEQCLSCSRGQRSDRIQGSTTCIDCGTGKVGDLRNGDASHTCLDCSAGSYASRGAMSRCDLCEAGRVQPNIAQSTCTNCSLGEFSDAAGLTGCTQCTPGRFADEPGKSRCEDCATGTRSQKQLGSERCFECPVGFVSYGDVAERYRCRRCSSNSVAPKAGMGQCITCQLNAVADVTNTECLCDVGFFANPIDPTDLLGAATCELCVKGARCETTGVDLFNIESDCGYWRADNTSIDFFRCVIASHCPCGGTATSAESTQCAGGRTGVVCSLCPTGYFARTITSDCEECPSQQQSLINSIVIGAAILIALILMYAVVIYTDQSLIEESRRIAEFKKENDWVWFMEDDGDPLQFRSKRFDAYDHDQFFNFNQHGPEPKPNIMYKMKIILGFFQITVNLALALDVQWPSYFQRFMGYFDIVNFNFIQWSNVDCVVTTGFYTRMLIAGAMPILLGILVAVFFLLPRYIKELRLGEDYDLRRAAQQRSQRLYWKLFLFTLFLIYPGVSSTILRLFVCRNINGTSYLLADMSIECFNAEWNKYALVSIPFIIIYPIGIPCFFLYMLITNIDSLSLPDVRMQLGFLYEAYHISLWWFELVDMMNKLFLTSILAFLPVDGQMQAGLTWAIGYLVVLLLMKPYVRDDDDLLHLYTQVEIFLFILAGYFFQTLAELDDTSDLAMSIVLILLVVVLLAIFVTQIVIVARKFCHNREQQKAAEDATTMADADKVFGEQDPEEYLEGETGDVDIRQLRLPTEARMVRNPLFTSSSSPDNFFGTDGLTDSSISSISGDSDDSSYDGEDLSESQTRPHRIAMTDEPDLSRATLHTGLEAGLSLALDDDQPEQDHKMALDDFDVLELDEEDDLSDNPYNDVPPRVNSKRM